MRYVLLIPFIFVLSIALGQQDTIVLRDGRIQRVQILDFDSTNYAIRYQKGKKSIRLQDYEYVQFKRNETWYIRNYKSNPSEFITSEHSNLQLRKSFFRHPSKHTSPPYSVGISYGFPISSGNATLEKNFSFNSRVTVSPEIRLHPKWSLQFSGVLGVGQRPPEETILFDLSYLKLLYNSVNTVHSGYLHYVSYDDPGITPFLYGENKDNNYLSPGEPHTKELLYQFGIASKFFPFGHSRFAFYIAPGFHFGIGNYNQVDYYTTFAYETNGWVLTEERAETTRQPVNYLRSELLTGLNINLNRFIAFNYEFGISSDMMLLGSLPEDRVYIRTAGNEYQFEDSFIHEPQINFRGAAHAFMIHRLYLVFRFGRKKQ